MSDRWGRMTRGALARFCRSAREPLSLLANPLVAGSHTASGHPCWPSAVLSPYVHREVARMPTRHAPGRPSLNARSKHPGRPPSRLPAKGDASDLLAGRALRGVQTGFQIAFRTRPSQNRRRRSGRRRQTGDHVHAVKGAACLETKYRGSATETCTHSQLQQRLTKSSTSRHGSRVRPCAAASHRVLAQPASSKWNRLGGWFTTVTRKWG